MKQSSSLLLVCCVLMMPRSMVAQHRDLALEDAIRIAREENPSLQAARLRADAAVERIGPAGTLPDPMLSLGLMNRPFTNPGNTDEPMTMNSVQLTQTFPWPGKLRYASERVRSLAVADGFDADEMELQLVLRVKELYYEVSYTDRALNIMRQTRDLLRNFHAVSNTLYSVGTGLQQDVLQAQVAVAGMTEDITVAEQRRVALVARLNALLGRAPDVPIGATVLPEASVQLTSIDAMMSDATSMRPALLAARQRVEAADAGYRAASRAVYPDFMVTLGYAHRPQFFDFSSLMVGVSLPIFAGSRYSPVKREMSSLLLAAEAQAADLYNETYAQLAELRADAVRSSNLFDLYASSVLPQARAAVESALSAYQVGRVDYMTLLMSEMTVNRYEIESVRLRADYLLAVARIEALVGTRNGVGL